jgi:hypothetical protein
MVGVYHPLISAVLFARAQSHGAVFGALFDNIPIEYATAICHGHNSVTRLVGQPTFSHLMLNGDLNIEF